MSGNRPAGNGSAGNGAGSGNGSAGNGSGGIGSGGNGATVTLTQPDQPPDDLVLPFRVDGTPVRGRLVRLGPVIDEILGRHRYPEPVARLLGEAVALTATLASALKYEGIFTLQTKGDGPVRLLVCDVTSDGDVRGYAQADAEALEALAARGEAAPASPVPRLLGAGHLAFTVDQDGAADRYQGIVELDGATLSDCAQHYFRQSEQLDTLLHLAVDRRGGAWRAAGLMVQRLPGEVRDADTAWDMAGLDDEAEEDAWRRSALLAGTASEDEMLDPALPPERLLYRLFHEDGVRVFPAQPLADRCRCSRARAERMLRMIGREERTEMLVDGRVVVTCQFCSREHIFDEAEIATLDAAETPDG